MKTLTKDSVGRKSMRFEELHQMLETEAKQLNKPSKRKKTQEDVADFSTFFAIEETATILKFWDHELIDDDLRAEFNFNRKDHVINTRGARMNFSNLVSYVFDDESLDILIDFNVKSDQGHDLPAIFYGKNEGKYYG